MIKLKNLSVGYGKKTILKNINCEFSQGKITVLIGANGCGKSTLLRTIAGIQQPLEGDVLINNQSISKLTENNRAKNIAYLPQSRNIPNISALRMVLHGRFPYLGTPRHYTEEDLSIAKQALKTVGMEDLGDCLINKLSGGQQQKVYIAMLLAQQTNIILMDEPTTFLDIACQLDIWELCKKMRSKGKTVIVVTHDILQALKYSDCLTVFDKGTMVAKGSGKDLLQTNIIENVFSVSITRFDNFNISIGKR